MKQRQTGKIGLGLIGIVLLGTAGCGRRSQRASTGQESSALQAQDLTQVTETGTDVQRDDPALIAAQIDEGKLILRTEQFTNPNGAPVRLWVQANSSVTAWGMCNMDGGQYSSSVLAPTLRSADDQTELSQERGGWVSFEVPANGSATIQWMTGGSFSWIPGPNPAPNVDCNQSNPQRGWSQFRLSGNLSEQVRVTPIGVEAGEATGDDRNLMNPARVWILPSTQDSLNLHCAG